MNPLKGFTEPESVAIVGVSTKPESISTIATMNLLKLGFKGKVYLVNQRGGELFGLKLYPDLFKIQDHVDLAVIYLPAESVVDAVMDCAKKGVKSVIVVSDGMDVSGDGGMTFTERMLQVARTSGIRIIGPNSMGVVNSQNRFSTSFVSFDRFLEGGLSLVAQTGLFTGAVLEWIVSYQGIGISKSIDLANKCDVNEIECLEYLSEDPSTKVIAMHIEEITDGRRFIEVARKTSIRKPIIAIKPGKSAAGAMAVASHTGSIAGRDESYNAAFLQSGIIRVYDIEELADLAKGFIHLPPLRGKRIGIVTYSGGWAALASDICEEFGLSIARLSEGSIMRIQEIAPPWRRITNPVDIWPPTKLDTRRTYMTSIGSVAEDDSTDAVLVLAPAIDSPIFSVLPAIKECVARYREKPIVTWAVGNREGMEKASSMIDEDCLFYPTLKRAIRVLSALFRYNLFVEAMKHVTG